MAANLIPELPVDTQVWQEINEAGQSVYYLVYQLPPEAAALSPGLENFTFRYKVRDLKEIAQIGTTVTPDVIVRKNGEVYDIEGNTTIDVDDYVNSFYFGTHTQLASIRGQVEDGALGFDYFIESLEQEAKYKPYLFSKNAQGQYDYLAVVLEAAKEGRTAREAELAQTTWWKTHTASERQEMLFAHQDPATFSKRGIQTREDIISKMMAAGITELDPKVIDAITQKAQYGVFDDNDVQDTINKLANPLIRYTLDPEVKAALEGKTLETIELTRQIENTINSILGPGVADNYNLEQLLADYQDNPTAFTQDFLPKLQDQFQAKFTQYEGTNVKAYEDIAPNLRSEWQSITGQRADETTAAWNQFIATNDVAERKDIAFAFAAESGSQAYRDQFKQDMESAFGKAGARSTGGGRFGL
tara:strand:+ start:34102 stop:35349 length:1248 start_codon:yes stop_codon:yes gene_type:complete